MLAVLSAAIRPSEGKVFQECRIVGLKGISYVIHVRRMPSYCCGSRFYREHFWQVLDFPFPGLVTQKYLETAAVASTEAAAMQ